VIFTDKNFQEEVLKSPIPVLVEFWASWCPPCKMVEPIIDRLEKEYMGRMKIGKMNVDINPVTAKRYNVKGLPTFIIFINGKIVYRGVAAKTENELRRVIEEILASQDEEVRV
jgi:thioredoxin 1